MTKPNEIQNEYSVMLFHPVDATEDEIAQREKDYIAEVKMRIAMKGGEANGESAIDLKEFIERIS